MNVSIPQEPYTVYDTVPQQPVPVHNIIHQETHIENVRKERIRADHGDHIHEKTINHIDVHQPDPIVETTMVQPDPLIVPRLVQPPPVIVRKPIIEHVKVRVPFTHMVPHLEEHVDIKEELIEEEYIDNEEYEEIVRETIVEEVVTKVPRVVEKRVMKTRPVTKTRTKVQHTPVVGHKLVDKEVTGYEDKVMEVTTH